MKIIKKTYKDQVVDYVYRLLSEGGLNPGDQLKETLLAEQMGISRAPIREAMKELIMNGLIEYRPQVGNFVPVLSAKQIIDSYTTRGVLEGYAVMESCQKIPPQEIDRLDHFLDQMEDYARQGIHKMVVETGGEFHDLLMSQCDNVQLVEYTDRLSLKLHVLFYKNWSKLYSPVEIGQRHRKILNSVKLQDLALIETVIRQHYAETGTKIAALQ
ncbi:GntR family transcriptional regulator [uncultured Desulfuromusa sp.]|uniref:GntR family transcriptional regulator n=1 Tax=uncultured Desulfuromusa sp. TaxID=219183 RepID=UPI002AA7B08D|nr:GntR family transcriptional regulator [uncultured Desulfuromusa sp.]